MSRFLKSRLRGKNDDHRSRAIPSTELHPALASLPQFTPSPIQLAPFADAEHHAHELVARFLHAAYPRAPTAEPPKTVFDGMFDESHSISGSAVHKGAKRQTIIEEGTPFIHAHGPGVWMPQVLAKVGNVTTEGNRLALLLPDAGKSGVHVPGRDGLPATTWEFRQVFRDVRRTPSPVHNQGGTPYASLWICRPLTPQGHRQRSPSASESAPELEVGIWVLFTREPDWQRKEERLKEGDVEEREKYTPPKDKGVGKAHVALARALMREVDADGLLPKVGWTMSLRPQGTYGGLALTIHHAHLFIPCSAFQQQTVMYALPESHSRPLFPFLSFSWEDEQTNEIKQGAMRLKFHGNVVGQDNLVKEAKWELYTCRMSRFFKNRGKGNEGYALQPIRSSAPGRRGSSPELHPELASLPQFTPSPIALAEFAKGEDHHQQLVDLFVHTAYPRAPTAEPQNEPWKASVHTAHSILGYPLSGDVEEHHALPDHTRIIFAYGAGVWQSHILAQTFHENSHGDRLALLLPDAGKSGVNVPGSSDLPATNWEYRQMLRHVSPTLSPTKHLTSPFPYASFWICRPLDKAGHRLKDLDGRDLGIVVVFVKDSDGERKVERQYDVRGYSKISLRLSYSPHGASPAFVELARALMISADEDGIPPAEGWTLHFLNNAKTDLCVKGAAAHVWVRCVAQLQSTVMYTLPEGRQGRMEPLMFSWQEDEVDHTGSTVKRRRHESVSARYTGKTVDKTSNLVTQTRWSVFPRASWPQALGGLQEIIFEV
ncbi:hypothetical protein BCR35DRAFT_328211 [Leucosporidium creatinivorum]|uniref:Uncharacterized protein n=1 Tax=Leucosporidium creatinivorum TaxID=106004 RepID=A0A1Y2G2L8_9BASI|nr:hypothetical protein BCR35DRAFT_328211 [Leucosporidium creatinivorum]